jgi:hypothetical protein
VVTAPEEHARGHPALSPWSYLVFEGAEFRLPLLISLLRFHGLEAVIPKKATRLVVNATAYR